MLQCIQIIFHVSFKFGAACITDAQLGLISVGYFKYHPLGINSLQILGSFIDVLIF